jgi:hypothetical protein
VTDIELILGPNWQIALEVGPNSFALAEFRRLYIEPKKPYTIGMQAYMIKYFKQEALSAMRNYENSKETTVKEKP